MLPVKQESVPTTSSGSFQQQWNWSQRTAKEEVPNDINAFFGHPLTAATSAIDGDDSNKLSLALLHEYKKLPPIETDNNKVTEGTDSNGNEVEEYLNLATPGVTYEVEISSTHSEVLSPTCSQPVPSPKDSRSDSPASSISQKQSQNEIRHQILVNTTQSPVEVKTESHTELRRALNNNKYYVNQIQYSTAPSSQSAHWFQGPNRVIQSGPFHNQKDVEFTKPDQVPRLTYFTQDGSETGHYGTDGLETMSVDSGICDNGLSPTQVSPRSQDPSVLAGQKRKHSGSFEKPELVTYDKREPDPTGFSYVLETPTAVFTRADEDRVTYLNKGQFYALSLEFDPRNRTERPLQQAIMKSVIVITFREERVPVDDMMAWNFWLGRQHNVRQKVIELDTKNSSGIIVESVREISNNAVSFYWTPNHEKATVGIALQCLSTDFSNQKGVKGLPLHIQVDTYEDEHSLPIHRGYCQIKVFCDKGAERKARDEQRRKESQLRSITDGSTRISACSRKKNLQIQPVQETTKLYSMLDLEKMPFLFFSQQPNRSPLSFMPTYSMLPQIRLNETVRDFSPMHSPHNLSVSSSPAPISVQQPVQPVINQTLPPAAKRKREDLEERKILIYVRRRNETVFTALLLRVPTLQGLQEAIEDKFHVPASSICALHKHSKKNIVVKMDDDIIRHFSHESTFEIDIRTLDHEGNHSVVLSEI